ncbi:MAG: cysteine--tRNA ligase, partial [Chloroflexi bacterium]|nr:cysteine--tRNA ligase [Chloroflexota bacterium]
PFARTWMHGAHLLAEGRKMSRSVGNVLRLKDLREQGVEPLAFRLLCLGISYRGHMNATWDSLKAAQSSLDKLRRNFTEWDNDTRTLDMPSAALTNYRNRFMAAINDDLGLPQVLALISELTKDAISPAAKALLLREWDEVLGLGLTEPPTAPVAHLSNEEQLLLDQRAKARNQKDFALADRLRDQLAARGILVKDTKEGQTWTKK